MTNIHEAFEKAEAHLEDAIADCVGRRLELEMKERSLRVAISTLDTERRKMINREKSNLEEYPETEGVVPRFPCTARRVYAQGEFKCRRKWDHEGMHTTEVPVRGILAW